MRRMFVFASVLGLLGLLGLVDTAGLAGSAHADALRAHATEPPGRHLIYAEALGKGGLYGVGYEYTLTPWLAVGAAASYAVVRDQQITTATPYLHGKLLQGARHALFAELGAMFVRSHVPSPVVEWDGMTDAGGGGFAALGWERDSRHLLLRLSASMIVGEGGATPWLGFAIGFRP